MMSLQSVSRALDSLVPDELRALRAAISSRLRTSFAGGRPRCECNQPAAATAGHG